MHGTTVLPKEGVTAGLSQNLAKKTVTAIKKWREGTEKPKHINYRLNQLQQDPPAQEALLESLEKNNEKRNSEIILEGDIEYIGNHININTNDREWLN